MKTIRGHYYVRHALTTSRLDLGAYSASVVRLSTQNPLYAYESYLPIQIIPMRSRRFFTTGKATVVPTEMWAFALPVWAYVLMGFRPMSL